MIALSDIIILTVSSAVLAVALTRSYTSGESHSDGPDKRTSNWIQSGTSSIQPSSSTLTPSQLGLPDTGASNAGSGYTNQGSDQAGIQPANNNTATTLSSPEPAAAPTSTPTTSAPEFASYVVRSGDSLSKIANQFNTTVSELQAINQLNGTRILVGQRLLYPKQ